MHKFLYCNLCKIVIVVVWERCMRCLRYALVFNKSYAIWLIDIPCTPSSIYLFFIIFPPWGFLRKKTFSFQIGKCAIIKLTEPTLTRARPPKLDSHGEVSAGRSSSVVFSNQCFPKLSAHVCELIFVDMTFSMTLFSLLSCLISSRYRNVDGWNLTLVRSPEPYP